MYHLTPSPFEALEEALPGPFSSGRNHKSVLQILQAEHARVVQWAANLEKLEEHASSALAERTRAWKKANQLMLEGLRNAADAISREDDDSLSKARVMLKAGHDLLCSY